MEDIMEHICNGETEEAALLLKENSAIKHGDKAYEPHFLEKAQYVNSAIYIFKTDAFKFGLSKMTTKNADKEEYLTEAVNSICSSKEYKTSVIVVKEKERGDRGTADRVRSFNIKLRTRSDGVSDTYDSSLTAIYDKDFTSPQSSLLSSIGSYLVREAIFDSTVSLKIFSTSVRDESL